MSSDDPHAARAHFTTMESSTQADWQNIVAQVVPYAKALPDRVLDHLRLLDGDFGGFPVDRLTHSLQTATRAHRDGRDEEYVVCALLHDIGDTLGTYNHADIAFTTAVQYNPGNPAWWTRAGWARENANKLFQALRAYEKALSINPRLADALEGKKRITDRMR